MSNTTSVSPNKEKKRPSVSTKCLLNIRTIITQNASPNRNGRNSVVHSSTPIPPPLPLADPTISLKESTSHTNGIKKNEDQKSRKEPSVPERNILIECLQNVSIAPAVLENGHTHPKAEPPQVLSCQTKSQELPIQVFPVQGPDFHQESHPSRTSLPAVMTSAPTVPPLPVDYSMYPFSPSPVASTSASHIRPPLSFPSHSSDRINEEYLTRMLRIVESSSNSNDTEPVELSIDRCPPTADHHIECASPSIPPLMSEQVIQAPSSSSSNVPGDKNIRTNGNGSRVFVNSSLNSNSNSKSDSSTNTSDQQIPMRSSESDHSRNEHRHSHGRRSNHQSQHHQFTPSCPTSYVRLPTALRQNPSSPAETMQSPTSNPTPPRRQFPRFESVRTPVQRSSATKPASPAIVPVELLDCCQTRTVGSRREVARPRLSANGRSSTTVENVLSESEARSTYFLNVAKIREIMAIASKRLAESNDLIASVPLVDTHCHFDLVFDRLRIRHYDVKKYFDDYSEFYPAGLSFELAIQVFWRPQHLTEKNWKYYSTYLDDERVYGSCGVHPHWSSAWEETFANDIERCLQHPKVVAIGEIGLDFGPKNVCAMHEQSRAFEAQLKLAAKWLKPIVIHSRDAYQETFDLMKKYLGQDHKIHLHCFVGTIDDVRLFTSYFNEIKFGFTPLITRTTFLHSVIQKLELTQILSETDSPYFVPYELSAYTRCAHPGMVYSVLETVAQLHHLPVIDVACQLRENARQIYGI